MIPAEDPSHALLHRAQELGHEARVRLDDHASLKLWLRLLACTTQIETEIRKRLRSRFGISLARFDYMAQLFRHREGLKMKELSRCLMVTGGNVTGLTDELERDALVVHVREQIAVLPKPTAVADAMRAAHVQRLRDRLRPERLRPNLVDRVG